MRKVREFTSGPHRVAVHRDHEWQEYRVRVYRDGVAYSPADYFTQDVEDAVDTAKAMLEREKEIAK